MYHKQVRHFVFATDTDIILAHEYSPDIYNDTPLLFTYSVDQTVEE